MAMTPLLLAWLGTFAALVSYLGLFKRGQFDDDWTPVLLTFLGAALWAMVGMGGFDVIVTDAVDPPVSEPVTPVAYVGIGLAMLVGLYQLADLLLGFGKTASETDIEEVFR